MKLNTITEGPRDAPRLLIVHGLFGSARNWGAIQRRLSDRYLVTSVDLRNHGESGWAESHTYQNLAEDLAETVEAPGHVLGHSMGGKAAMALALGWPEMVERLVVADIAPVAYGHSQIEYVNAMKGLDLEGIGSRREADGRLAEAVEDRGTRAFLLQSLDYKAGKWALNLDVLGREMGRITGWDPVEGVFEGAALFLSGEKSDYVQDAHKPLIREQFPHARFVEMKGVGHWLHAEKPQETAQAVGAFLSA